MDEKNEGLTSEKTKGRENEGTKNQGPKEKTKALDKIERTKG